MWHSQRTCNGVLCDFVDAARYGMKESEEEEVRKPFLPHAFRAADAAIAEEEAFIGRSYFAEDDEEWDFK